MKTVVLGLGNPLKQDDNIGNLIVDKLSKKIKDKNFTFIQAFLTPENYLMSVKISNPDSIYFIDAVEFEGKIGEVKVFDFDKIKHLGKVSTHNIPITIYKTHLPKAKINLIGIKVKDIIFDDNLSEELQTKFDNIVKEIENILS